MTENQVIVDMLVSGQNDLEWFNSHIHDLLPRFNGQFVALKNRSVLDADADLNTLLFKLKRKNIDTSAVFIRFVSSVKAVLLCI